MTAPKPKSILCVDDDAINQLVVMHMLKPLGYRVVLAASGTEALQLLQQEVIDLVLLDIYMPEMNGFETAAAIRKHFSGIPIAFISAGADEQLQHQMNILAISHFIAKPIDKAVLVDAVEHLLQ